MQRTALLRMLIGLLVSPVLLGQIEKTDYQIEVLCFEHTQVADVGQETWPKFLGKFSSDHTVSLYDSEMPATDPNKKIDLPTVAPKKLLAKESTIIKQHSAYRWLLHEAWQQSIGKNARATPVWLTQARDGMRWQGHVSVKPQGKVFSVNLDAVFEKADASGLMQYRLTHQARMKAKEAYYYDHPAFGVIVMVQPVQAMAASRE